MKLKYLALSIILLFTNLFGNVNNTQETKTDLLCIGKWHAKYGGYGDEKIPIPLEQNKIWMLFYKNGDHEVRADNKIKKGQWEFSKNKDSIFFTTEEGKKKYMRIKKLTKKELDVVFIDNRQEITLYMEKVESK